MVASLDFWVEMDQYAGHHYMLGIWGILECAARWIIPYNLLEKPQYGTEVAEIIQYKSYYRVG